ncbi:hypothetical protein FPOAC1_000412 [Fusarium poae]|uniref:Uncharacterized protein n=1 Tax=Fusarium poae TaxID=36050 RepID=A0A1B8B152_FUSPO|nr:hypothetical protein FPOAC1_000412 [Fusarium poae]KAG8674444.1 hypothetical protein FPOAC1_000412 [Fusarium poae]OBS26454.1 hypothetical protein FPOA_00396 [Fusarium poae]
MSFGQGAAIFVTSFVILPEFQTSPLHRLLSEMGKLKASTAGTVRYPKFLWVLRWLHRVQGVKVHDNLLLIQACIPL